MEADAFSENAVVFRGVHKSFGALHVLRDVTFEVRTGEVLVLCGPSGSGKSTLLRCINALEPIDKGEIIVERTALGGLSGSKIRELRSKIGVVFQQFNLYPHMTVLDNITLAPIRIKKINRQEARDRAHDLLARVGMPEKWNSYPGELSGGQQQRVAIARALAMGPSIMLLDEPTSALDPEMIGEVLQVIAELAHSGMTLVVVTHEIDFARHVADRVAFLEGGRLLNIDTTTRVFSSEGDPRVQRFLKRLEPQLSGGEEV